MRVCALQLPKRESNAYKNFYRFVESGNVGSSLKAREESNACGLRKSAVLGRGRSPGGLDAFVIGALGRFFSPFKADDQFIEQAGHGGFGGLGTSVLRSPNFCLLANFTYLGMRPC